MRIGVRLTLALRGLDFGPLLLDLIGAIDLLVAKDMRMAANQLIANRFGDISQIKATIPLLDRRLKNHLKQQIAKFVAMCCWIVFIDRLQHLISFFDQIVFESNQGLLAVPGTASRRKQALHNRIKPAYRLSCCSAALI